MDSQFPTGGTTPKRPLQIQGPRPTPLKVGKDSHKIRKPPHPPPHAAAAGPPPAADQRRQPVIIYAVSPKVIHAEESEFMSIVQRYTGLSSVNFSGDGDVSPAARLAVTEKASPGPREKTLDSEIMGDGGMEEGLIRPPTGILSPAPDTLPTVSTGTFFTPASEARMMSPWHDWSPMVHGSGFMASPSTLLSGPLISSPNSDIFAQIWNF
ncbi:putative Ankyrin repeat family protein [Hibiscus syriacus]|uniref:Ankyrin repeat family protein n=1 Tax=Hibiscus syriacus TaxID=106335 RepID=A0A6A3AVB0_HIBSY|nr:protein MKS1-like [Hibiscus syriacus]KAE8706809.1 putative Ankyrin repeat family protein [Hibiscus syriacus]